MSSFDRVGAGPSPKIEMPPLVSNTGILEKKGANIWFEKLRTCLVGLKNISFFTDPLIVTKFTKLGPHFGNAIDFIDLTNLYCGTNNNNKEWIEATKSGDCTKMLDAGLSTVKLAGSYLSFIGKTATFIYDHFNFNAAVSALAPVVAKVCSVASIISSFAKIAQNGLHYHTTHKFMAELKRERHLAFIKTYFDRMQISPQKPIAELSSKELKRKIKILKSKLKNEEKDEVLSGIAKVANQAFVKALADRMTTNSEVFSLHFNAEVKKIDSLKERLSSLAASDDTQKLSSAVKLLKQQGRCTERSHIFSMVVSGIESTNSILRLALGAINPLIVGSISAGIALVTTGATLVQYCVKERESEKFVNAMEKVLA